MKDIERQRLIDSLSGRPSEQEDPSQMYDLMKYGVPILLFCDSERTEAKLIEQAEHFRGQIEQDARRRGVSYEERLSEMTEDHLSYMKRLSEEENLPSYQQRFCVYGYCENEEL